MNAVPSIRDIISILESAGAENSRPVATFPDGFSGNFWLQSKTGHVVLTSDYYADEHIDSVLAHPDWFGFDKTEMQRAFPEEYEYEMNRLNRDPDSENLDPDDLDFMKVYKFTIERKWSRCSYSRVVQGLNIDADTTKDAQFVLRQIMDKCHVSTVHLSISRPKASITLNTTAAIERFYRFGR